MPHYHKHPEEHKRETWERVLRLYQNQDQNKKGGDPNVRRRDTNIPRDLPYSLQSRLRNGKRP